MRIVTRVLSRVAKCAVLVLLIISIGGHWVLLQSVAWVGMMANYSRQASFKDAVCKTFDGQHPCPLCKLIRAGKASEQGFTAPQHVNKFDLFAKDNSAFRFPPLPKADFPAHFPSLIQTEAPPLPPPRPFFG